VSAYLGRGDRRTVAERPPEVPVDDLDQELDRLYALEPATFVAARDALVRELRDSGRREEAAEVKSLRKPTVSAWAINQLTRQERRQVDLLLDAGHRLREAQQGLLAGQDPSGLAEARRTERDALASLRKAARGILAEAGRESETTLNRITETLQSAAVSSEGRELLARGRLTGDLEATGFELLAPLAEGAPRKQEHAGKRKPPVRSREAKAGREQARKRLEEARLQVREARATERAAEKELRAAEREAAKARRELDGAEERLQKRQDAASEARSAVERAEQAAREAEGKA
jgi:hypothetical protein